MKTNSLKQNNSKILAANNRTVKVNGQVYLIRVQTLGPMILADAEPLPQGGIPINIFNKTVLAKSIRDDVEKGLFS
jgi:hypothetical protein